MLTNIDLSDLSSDDIDYVAVSCKKPSEELLMKLKKELEKELKKPVSEPVVNKINDEAYEIIFTKEGFFCE